MKSRFIICVAFLLFAELLRAAPEGLKFEEVFGLLRTNLTDLSEAELSNAAALGLIQQLGSKVQLVGTNTPMAEAGASNAITRTNIFSQHFGYIRLEEITPNIASDIERSWKSLSASNHLKGAILDLRYAKGLDYQKAGEAANLFVQNEQLLMEFGGQEFHSSKTGQKIHVPVAVLVNRQTSGAAEALAGCLREAGAALVIGSNTAGEARQFQTFELSTGQKLRVGTVPVMIGGKTITMAGLAPDINVSVSTLDERAYYQDPFVTIPRGFAEARSGANEVVSGSTNRTRRFNEAELVRRHREGLDLSAALDESPSEPGKQIVMDPALARAIDFLKGLAALRYSSAD